MSQVLEKPILLDETGQAIAGKLDTNSAAIIEALDDIKDAISTGSEFTPVMIKVTTPPAKVAYMTGEPLDLSGIVVSLIASNGVQIDVTDQCTFVPVNGTPLTASDTSVAISYYWYRDDVTFTTSYPIGVKSLSSIAITTPPTTTYYYTGDQLDLTGIVVTATYDDGTFLDVTQNCTFSPSDGTVLAENNTTVTVSYTEGTTTKTATQPISVVTVYGVEWDGTASTAWTRTETSANFEDPNPYYASMTDTPSSPFDNIMPWAGMVVSTIDNNVLVSIPKFYYKLTKDGSKLKIQIANEPLDGFSVSPAHMDRGDGVGERDLAYISRFPINNGSKSQTRTAVYTGKTRYQFATGIRLNNSGDVWQCDFTMMFTIWLLYLVEFADWDSQAKIGIGNSDSGSAQYTGYTDNMPYHTGTMAATRATNHRVQYRYIEDLWCNYQTFISGICSNTAKTCIILNPTKLGDSYMSDGISIGSLPSYGVPSAFDVINPEGLYPLFIPTAVTNDDATYTTYMSDEQSWAIRSGSQSGYYTSTDYRSTTTRSSGIFGIHSYTDSSSNAYTGTRLMKLPANS